jgi:hypothetical protein
MSAVVELYKNDKNNTNISVVMFVQLELSSFSSQFRNILTILNLMGICQLKSTNRAKIIIICHCRGCVAYLSRLDPSRHS